jgi:hypothetical protein
MKLRNATYLRIVAVWTFFVWIVFVKNIVGDSDHSFGFKAVHVVLAIISITLAVGVLAVVRQERAD